MARSGTALRCALAWRPTRAALLALGLAVACGLETRGEATLVVDGGQVGGAAGASGTGGALDDASFGGAVSDAVVDLPPEAEPLPYAFRRRLRVEAGPSGIPAGASISYRFDHAALVAAQKSRADGADVRIFYRGAGESLELDRRVDPVSEWGSPTTLIWFRAELPVSGVPDESYYIYYGDPAAGAPPEDGSKVYAFWDDFDGTTLGAGWSTGAIGSANGNTDVSGGRLRVEGTTGDIWGSADDFFFVSRSVPGNFVADTLVVSYGGSITGWARLGGIMLRVGPADDAKHATVSPVGGAAAVGAMYRPSKGAYADADWLYGANPVPEYVRMERVLANVRAWHSDDGVVYKAIGPGYSFQTGLPDALMVGIPFANLSNAVGFVQVEWFRIRAWLAEDPLVTSAPEEPGPFLP